MVYKKTLQSSNCLTVSWFFIHLWCWLFWFCSGFFPLLWFLPLDTGASHVLRFCVLHTAGWQSTRCPVRETFLLKRGLGPRWNKMVLLSLFSFQVVLRTENSKDILFWKHFCNEIPCLCSERGSVTLTTSIPARSCLGSQVLGSGCI